MTIKMPNIDFRILGAEDQDTFHVIAGWYLMEWKIPVEKTLVKLGDVVSDRSQFQVLMILDHIPVATAGLYSHVGLLDKEPRFRAFKHWLALVYTVPEKRHLGYGAMICNYVQDHAREIGIDTMHLFTDTAERLYTRLGWTEIEKAALGDRKVTVMNKIL